MQDKLGSPKTKELMGAMQRWGVSSAEKALLILDRPNQQVGLSAPPPHHSMGVHQAAGGVLPLNSPSWSPPRGSSFRPQALSSQSLLLLDHPSCHSLIEKQSSAGLGCAGNCSVLGVKALVSLSVGTALQWSTHGSRVCSLLTEDGQPSTTPQGPEC